MILCSVSDIEKNLHRDRFWLIESLQRSENPLRTSGYFTITRRLSQIKYVSNPICQLMHNTLTFNNSEGSSDAHSKNRVTFPVS